MINFGDCLVRTEGAIGLAAVLKEGLPILKVSSHLWPRSLSVNSQVTFVCSIPSFQELNLSFGEITEAAAVMVAQAVVDKPHLEKVDLNGTDASV